MRDPDALRAALLGLRQELESVGGANRPSTGGFVGDAANDLRIDRDKASGRLALRAAHRDVCVGLDFWDEGNFESAAIALASSTDLTKAAYRAQMTPQNKAALATPAKRPGRTKAPGALRSNPTAGRPSTLARDLLIAEAVAAAKAGWPSTQAIAEAKRQNPALFKGIGLSGIREAMRRVKKSATKPPKK